MAAPTDWPSLSSQSHSMASSFAPDEHTRMDDEVDSIRQGGADDGSPSGPTAFSQKNRFSTSGYPLLSPHLFIAQLFPDPADLGYALPANVQAHLDVPLTRSLLTSIPSTAHLIPRASAPSLEHAFNLIAASQGSITTAQEMAIASQQPSTISPTVSPTGQRPVGPEYGEDRRGMNCGHLLSEGEPIYRCRTCALDDTCVQCAPCFNASDHQGHDVVFNISKSGGGCCDCGDPEAWTRPVRCKFHDAIDSLPDDDAGPSMSRASTVPEHNTDSSSSAVPAATAKGKGTDLGPSATHLITPIDALLDGVPAPLLEPLEAHVTRIVDFILQTLEHAPERQVLPHAIEAIDDLKLMSSLEPPSQNQRKESDNESLRDHAMRDGSDNELIAFSEMDSIPGAYSFDSASTSDSFDALRGTPRRDSSTSAPPRIYSVVLWNDEKHDFESVISTVQEAVQMSSQQAKGVAEKVDKHGREVVTQSTDLRRLLQAARTINRIKLAVTIEPAYDVFAEEVAGQLIRHLLDLSNATLYVPPRPPNDRNTSSHPLDALVPNASAMRAVIAKVLMHRWDRKPSTAVSFDMDPSFYDPNDLCKLDGLLLMDTRLWKSARVNLTQLFMVILGPKEVRKEVALRFAALYPKLVETLVMHDREHDLSMCYMTVQLFSVPSIATMLVKEHGFLKKLLLVMQAIFTGTSHSTSLRLPPIPPPGNMADATAIPSRQPRCYHSFYDLRYLLQAQGVQQYLACNDEGRANLIAFTSFLALFNDITPVQRAVTAHVEFESEICFTVFDLSAQLARAAKLYGEAFSKANLDQLVASVTLVFQHILFVIRVMSDHDPKLHPPIFVDAESYGSHTYMIVQHAVDRDPVSFHHPLHWLLAEMLRNVNVTSPTGQVAGAELPERIRSTVSEANLLIVLDYPLRVASKLAQVRAGLWVRNGYALRSQAQHFRETSMRDFMNDQNIYLLQCALVLINKDDVLVTFMHRFGILGWLDSGFEHPDFDPEQRTMVIEEFFLLLITLLSDMTHAAQRPTQQRIRTEIIHFLALGQSTYSELIKHISERLTSDVAFEAVLAQVSRFRAPDGTTDLGIFELRDECYAEVEPYFVHYTRNERERAEEVLRTRRKAATGSDGITIPRATELPRGSLFDGALRSTFMSPVFIRMLHNSIHMAAVEAEALRADLPDVVIDATLHLLMLGIVEDSQHNIGFTAQLATQTHVVSDDTSPAYSTQSSLLMRLCLCESNAAFKAWKPKISWIIDQALEAEDSGRVINTAGAVRATVTGSRARGGTGDLSPSTAPAIEDPKRAAAKARQAAIMQRFSAQQKLLLEAFEDEDDIDGHDTNTDSAVEHRRSGDHSSDEASEYDNVEMDSEGLESSAPLRSSPRAHRGDMPVSHGSSSAMNTDGGVRSVKLPAQSSKQAPSMIPGKTAPKFLGNCIMCQEQLDSSRPFGGLAHIHSTQLVRTTPQQSGSHIQQVLSASLDLDRVRPASHQSSGIAGASSADLANSPRWEDQYPDAALFPRKDHRPGFYASTCGHHMHFECFKSYNYSVQQRHLQQIARNHPEDRTRLEFVCPLCKSLGNAILPVPDFTSAPSHIARSAVSNFQVDRLYTGSLNEWIRKINIDILKDSTISSASDLQEVENGTGAFVPWFIEEPYLRSRDEPSYLSDLHPAEHDMLRRLSSSLNILSAETLLDRTKWQYRSILAPPTTRIYIPEEIIGYTISVLEIEQRGVSPRSQRNRASPSALLDLVPERSLHLLRSLIHTLRMLGLVEQGPAGLHAMRHGLLKRLLPHWGGDDTVRSPLLLRDPMSILVEAAVLDPSSLRQVTALMYYASLVHVVFGLAQPSVWPSWHGSPGKMASWRTGADIEDQDIAIARLIFPDVRWTVANIIGYVGYARGNITLGVDNLDDASLAKLLCSYTLPFLRRAAILHRVIGLELEAPEVAAYAPQQAGSEYARLLRALHIPWPSEAMPPQMSQSDRPTAVSSLVEGWIKHAYAPLASLFRPLPIQPSLASASGTSSGNLGDLVVPGPLSPAENPDRRSGTGQPYSFAGSPPAMLLEHPHIYELAPLAQNLAALLLDSRSTTCKRCKTVPKDPALCLLCGETLCFQSSMCCMDEDDDRGECSRHTDVCGKSMGIFFCIRSNVVLLLHQRNGTFTHSPYLDSHGEIDLGLRKGRPQFLQHQRYDELRKQWLQHGVANMVARKVEASMDQGGWPTF